LKRLTFRQKLLLTYAAFALAIIFTTFVSVSYYINSLQKQNVADAVKLAEEQASKIAAAVREMVTAPGSAGLDDPGVKEGLRAITKINLSINKSIIWAAIITPDGDRYIEEVAEGGRDYHLQRDETAKNVSDLDLPNGNQIQVEVTAKPEGSTDITFPVTMESNQEGYIKLRVEKSGRYQRIEESSQRITRALVFVSILMLAFLLGIFFVLWRMFFRHLELQENNARLDRMAYVGTLASGLAHEIRNPLSSMNVNLEVIREELSELDSDAAERSNELSGRVQREVQQLNSTLTSFLDFALPRKEGYSQFSLRGLVDELVDAHAEELKLKNILVEVSSPQASATIIEADRHLMHQAIRNVLVNAIQVLSGSIKKSIYIKLETLPRDRIRLAISDTGPGISQEHMAQIFEVFFSTRKGGSGFGLAIARKIVEEHSGEMWAENNKDSLGATFIMVLPAFARQDADVKHANAGGGIARLWSGQLKTKDERI